MSKLSFNKQNFKMIMDILDAEYDGLQYFASIFKYRGKRFLVKTANCKDVGNGKRLYHFMFNTKNIGKLDYYLLVLNTDNISKIVCLPKKVFGNKTMLRIIDVNGWNRFEKYQFSADKLKENIDRIID
jgi:hypothetical protein